MGALGIGVDHTEFVQQSLCPEWHRDCCGSQGAQQRLVSIFVYICACSGCAAPQDSFSALQFALRRAFVSRHVKPVISQLEASLRSPTFHPRSKASSCEVPLKRRPRQVFRHFKKRAIPGAGRYRHQDGPSWEKHQAVVGGQSDPAAFMSHVL